jgi:type II secretory pathway component PulF
LADALRPLEHRLPPFLLPLIAAGELTGRLDEVLRHAAQHCRMMARPRRAVRNAWLAPLAIYLVAIPLHFLLLVLSGNWSGIVALGVDTTASVGSLAVTAGLLIAPPLKPAWDRLRLFVPVWGPAERDLNVSLFLRIFGLLYATGGARVEVMIRSAARSAANHHVRYDLLRAAADIELGSDLAHAFKSCTCLHHDERQTLAAGELSGTVERACERLANQLDEVIESRMKIVTAFALRLTVILVSMTLIGALVGVVSALVLGA